MLTKCALPTHNPWTFLCATQSYVNQVKAKYRRPIWITEFSCSSQSAATQIQCDAPPMQIAQLHWPRALCHLLVHTSPTASSRWPAMCLHNISALLEKGCQRQLQAPDLCSASTRAEGVG